MNSKNMLVPAVPMRRLGDGSFNHFFGYYNKSVWDASNRYVLAHRTTLMTSALTPDLECEVGYFDTQRGDAFRVLARTNAWNWQMGSQLQWLGRGRSIIFNRRSADSDGLYRGFASTIIDIDTGTARDLSAPIYVAAPNGEFALSVNYRRLFITHETIGYPEPGGPFRMPLAPDDDGIQRIDIDTGRVHRLVSYRDLRNFHPRPSMERAIHWVSHIEINPASSRILFLHRWTERVEDETCFLHRLITMNPDGSGLRLLECSDHPLPQLSEHFDPAAVGTFDYEKSEYQISHPLWQDNTHIIVWGPHAGRIHYHLYEDSDAGRVQVIGDGVLKENGHMTYSPTSGRWLLSDTYPDAKTDQRILFLFDTEAGIRHDLGSFYTPPWLKKVERCDLHPRWNHDGRLVCIDSVHEGSRQMYVLDVSSVVTG